MTNPKHETFLSILTPLNRTLLSVLVVFICGVSILVYLGNRKVEALVIQENHLKKQSDDLIILENFFKSLVKENESVEKDLSYFSSGGSYTSDSELRSLALQHRLVPGWVEDIRYGESGAELARPALGFSIIGSYSNFSSFLRELISDPHIGCVTLIQIQSEFELLDIMVNIEPEIHGLPRRTGNE